VSRHGINFNNIDILVMGIRGEANPDASPAGFRCEMKIQKIE
jgi:hypothetical protein